MKHRDYKKVRHEGGSRVLALGKLLPPKWQMVKLEKVSEVKGMEVVVRIVKVA